MAFPAEEKSRPYPECCVFWLRLIVAVIQRLPLGGSPAQLRNIESRSNAHFIESRSNAHYCCAAIGCNSRGLSYRGSSATQPKIHTPRVELVVFGVWDNRMALLVRDGQRRSFVCTRSTSHSRLKIDCEAIEGVYEAQMHTPCSPIPGGAAKEHCTCMPLRRYTHCAIMAAILGRHCTSMPLRRYTHTALMLVLLGRHCTCMPLHRYTHCLSGGSVRKALHVHASPQIHTLP